MIRLFLTVCLAVFSAGCSSRYGDPIHFVIPDDYRGPFRIISDGIDGGGYRYDSNRHVYTIPSDGVLHVLTSRPMELFHRESAEYASGARIYWYEPAAPSASDVRLVALGSSDRDSHWYAVGDESEILRLQGAWNESGPVSFEKLLPRTQTAAGSNE